MRRILKSLLVNEEPKGLSTLLNPKSVDEIKKIISEKNKGKIKKKSKKNKK